MSSVVSRDRIILYSRQEWPGHLSFKIKHECIAVIKVFSVYCALLVKIINFAHTLSIKIVLSFGASYLLVCIIYIRCFFNDLYFPYHSCSTKGVKVE